MVPKRFGEEGWIHVHKWHSDSQDRRLDGRFFVVDMDAHLKERLRYVQEVGARLHFMSYLGFGHLALDISIERQSSRFVDDWL